MDRAGVEAGAKILVPFEGEPLGSIAHTATEDQTRRSVVCASNRTVEDVLNIDIFFFRSSATVFASGNPN